MNTFFTSELFNNNHSSELSLAEAVYKRLASEGPVDGKLFTFTFIFVSDDPGKLNNLKAVLANCYKYTTGEIKREDNWEMNGVTIPFPLSIDNIQYWAIDMFYKGYEYDCRFVAYETTASTAIAPGPPIHNADNLFDEGLKDCENGNLIGAIINWSASIAINPADPDYHYSIAIAKEDLNFSQKALADYNTAIELAPDFVSARINRGALLDKLGRYENALNDYNAAITIDPNNSMAYLNRGNTKFNLQDNRGACKDWKMAKELGEDVAGKRFAKNCSC